MIDPHIWEDPSFNSLSIEARLLFVGMFSNADDEGYLRGDAGSLKRLIFGFDNIELRQMEETLLELKNMRSLHFYEVDGEQFAHFKKWNDYQKQQKDRIQASVYPKCSTCLADDTQMLTKVKLSKEKIREVNNNDDKKSDDFSEIKKSLGIPEPTRGGVTQEFQAEAIRIAEALNVPKSRYSAYFKAVKEEPRAWILESFGFAVDHPERTARDKMFFWKLNTLKEAAHGKTQASN